METMETKIKKIVTEASVTTKRNKIQGIDNYSLRRGQASLLDEARVLIREYILSEMKRKGLTQAPKTTHYKDGSEVQGMCLYKNMGTAMEKKVLLHEEIPSPFNEGVEKELWEEVSHEFQNHRVTRWRPGPGIFGG